MQFPENDETEMKVLIRLLILSVLIALSPLPARAADLPRDVAKMIQEGNDFLAQDKPKEALEVFDKALAKAPEAAEIAFNRGVALYRLGHFDQAQSAFQDSMKRERPDLEARAKYNLARTAHASALARKDDPEGAVNDLTRAIGFYNDALALKADDADAAKNLDLARRMQEFLQRKLAQQQQEQPSSQPSSQPSDENNEPSSQPGEGEPQPSSQPSEEQEQNPTSQNSDDQNSNQEQQSDSSSAEESEQQENSSEPDDQDGENQNESEQQESDEQDRNDNLNSNGSESKQEEQEEQQAQATTQPEDESATTQPSMKPTSIPTSLPVAIDPAKLTEEQALRMLQEARDAERSRRYMQRMMRLRRQGRVPVDKDW